uniref:SAP domain-containing ribonucleoprotein n=1 Tax=Lepisosteus oculatus TaxID=7918 RepID=W5M7E1_LEPOC
KMAEVVELHKLKLAELKQECAARGLEVKGNKSDLISRLQAYLEEHAEEEVNEEEVLREEAEEEVPKAEDPPPEKPARQLTPEPVQETVEKKVVKISPPVSLDESTQRLQKRAERFNVPATGESKKAARAARFGLPIVPPTGTSASSKPAVNVDVLKKRAQRFGMNVSSLSKKVEEDEKLKKRKERFGIVTGAAAAVDDVEAKKRKRAERFGNV